MIEFTLNGQVFRFDGEHDTPLLWVIRDEAGLTGTKFGCGIGQCGACTVHVDGAARRSCSLPVSALAGSTVTTIEGLSHDASHPVQQAWIELDVAQCGYCQVGQIMAGAALLDRHDALNDELIDREHTNLCRCGTYSRIRKALYRAADIQAGRTGDEQ